MMDFKESSIITGGVSSIDRVNNLLVDCNEHRRIARSSTEETEKVLFLDMWVGDLESLYNEIYPKMNKEEIKNVDEKFKLMELSKNVWKITNQKEFGRYGKLVATRQIDYIKFSNLYLILDILERSLRKIAYDKKLLASTG